MATRRDRGPLRALTIKPSEATGDDPVIDRAEERAIEPQSAEATDRRALSIDAGEAIEMFFDLAVDELLDLRTRAEIDAIEQAAGLILECESRGGRVHVTGIGKSEHVARYFASLLSSTGTPAYFLHATECIHGSAGQVCSSDVTIAISNSGTTPELMCAVEALRNVGSKIIGVSGNRRSPLAVVADVLIYAGVYNEGGELNLVPRASILAKIYVLCALSVALETHKGLTREQYARWHPGGALGRLARGE
ncbi:MAG TPA: SIS domain-containing protein [Blastocatellia bacterium]|nr:SIS domain-containing protein [Blastocatellia bacterium]